MAFFKRNLSSRSETRKRRRRRLRVSLFVISGIAVLAGGAVWLSYRPELSIANITVSGNALVSEQSIRATVEEALAGERFRVFNKRNIFLYPARRISEHIQADFPRIAAASVARTSLTGIGINIKERTPAVLACASRDAPSSQCYFADRNGLIFAPAPMFTGHVYFTVYGTPRGERREHHVNEDDFIGRSLLPQDIWRRVQEFREELQSAGTDPVALVIKEHGDLAFQFRNGVMVYFNTKQSFRVAMHNLLSAFDTDALDQSDLTRNTPRLEYIDVRFGDKVFVK